MDKSGEISTDIVLHLPKLPEAVFNISFLQDVEPDAPSLSDNLTLVQPMAAGPTFMAPLVKTVILTDSDDVKTVVDMILDLTDSSIDYQPGDCLGIVPFNSLSEVDQLLRHLHLLNNADLRYKLDVKEGMSGKSSSTLSHIPISSTIRNVLQYYLEIRAVPKKLFLRVLAEYTSEPKERRRLEELCSREGSKEFTSFITEARTSVIDIFQTFPSCDPPIERLFEFLPRLHARPYSVASSPLNGSEVSIVFSLIELPPKHYTKDTNRYGVCTGWLYRTMLGIEKTLSENMQSLSLSNDDSCKPKIPVFLRKNNGFRLPEDLSVPLILIGPGTGVAPFIGFLQHRDHQRQSMGVSLKEQTLGDIWLFFGCRYSDKDFIFKSEIYDFLNRGVLSRLFLSFSRMDTVLGHEEARYVQHNITRHSKEFVSQIMEKRGTVYVCGDAKNMVRDVSGAIVSALMVESSVSEKEARETVFQLKKDGRYIEDVWT